MRATTLHICPSPDLSPSVLQDRADTAAELAALLGEDPLGNAYLLHRSELAAAGLGQSAPGEAASAT